MSRRSRNGKYANPKLVAVVKAWRQLGMSAKAIRKHSGVPLYSIYKWCENLYFWDVEPDQKVLEFVSNSFIHATNLKGKN